MTPPRRLRDWDLLKRDDDLLLGYLILWSSPDSDDFFGLSTDEHHNLLVIINSCVYIRGLSTSHTCYLLPLLWTPNMPVLAGSQTFRLPRLEDIFSVFPDKGLNHNYTACCEESRAWISKYKQSVCGPKMCAFMVRCNFELCIAYAYPYAEPTGLRATMDLVSWCNTHGIPMLNHAPANYRQTFSGCMTSILILRLESMLPRLQPSYLIRSGIPVMMTALGSAIWCESGPLH